MRPEIIIGVSSSLIGGTAVALITHLSTHRRTNAEARKLEAEAERLDVETAKMRAELNTRQASSVLRDDLPWGWFKAGSEPDDYVVGVDREIAYTGTGSGFIRSFPNPRGFATLMQAIKADEFRGKRLQLSGFVKTEDVRVYSALWLRIDGPAESFLLDNMQNRPIVGTVDWRRYRIVLDVEDDSLEIAFGVFLRGEGAVWVDDLEFQVVDDTVPVTWHPKEVRVETTTRPLNLDFEART